MGNKERLFEMMGKVDPSFKPKLNEENAFNDAGEPLMTDKQFRDHSEPAEPEYDDVGAGPEPINDLDPQDMRQVRELHVMLTKDGIPDIYEVYPKWLVDAMKENKYIEEDSQAFAWFFTDEAKNKFPSPDDLQKWLFTVSDDGGSGNDSEAPYLRGREDSNLSF